MSIEVDHIRKHFGAFEALNKRVGAFSARDEDFLDSLASPAAIAIDEALELARKFSGEDSVQFVNGVLDAIHRELSPPPEPPPEAPPPA